MYIVVPFVDRVRKIDWCYSEAVNRNNSVGTVVIHKNFDIVDLREKVLDFG